MKPQGGVAGGRSQGGVLFLLPTLGTDNGDDGTWRIQGGAVRAENPGGAKELEGRGRAGGSPDRDVGGGPELRGGARAEEPKGERP